MRRPFAALFLVSGIAAPVALGQGAPATVFETVPPCRFLDTRQAAGPYGAPSLQPGVARSFILTSVCNIPAGALALSVNATVTGTTGLGQLVLYAGDIATPDTNNLSFGAGQTRAAASIVGIASDGTLKALVTGGAADFILDVNGYFIASSGPTIVTLDSVPDQTIPTNTTLSLRLSGHSTDALDALTYGLVSGPAGASVSPLGVFAYVPTQGQIGARSVTAQVHDGGGHSAQATFQVTVVDHDHPPVMGPLPDDLTRVGASYTKVLTATDPDIGDTLTFSLLSGPAGMTLSGATLSWTPAVTQLGNWPVRVKVTDSAGLSDSGLFHVGIQFLVATDDAYQVNLGQTLTVNAPGVLGNDLDPLSGPLTAAKVTNPDKGSLNSFNADGSFVYQAPAVVDPVFSPVVRYHVDSRVYADPPLVADVDGDGKPELIFLGVGGSGSAGISAVRGTDGSVLWQTAALPAPYSDCTAGMATGGGLYHLAVGDIDDSGQLSIVFPTSCGRDNLPSGIVGTNTARYAALNAKDGTVKWLSPPLSRELDGVGNPDGLASGTVPTLARVRPGETPSIVVGLDLSYFLFNGKPECDQLIPGWPAYVMCRGVVVLDGKDGAVRQRMAAPTAAEFDRTSYGNGFQAAVVADLDGDGNVEFVFGGGVFNNDGSVRSNNNSDGTGYSLTLWSGLGNFDDTPDIEVARLEGTPAGSGGGYRLAVYKSDGRLLWSLPLPATGYTGLPVVADVDGTGRPAIVFNVDGNVCAIDYRGNYKWCHDVGAPGGISNISIGSRVQVYDLDGDGVPEVIVQVDGEILLFLDGKTGSVKYSFDLGAANGPPFYPPYLDYGTGGPILGDFDGSGHASIATYWGGVGRLEVVGAAGNDWRPVRNIFNQESYQFGNIKDDGTMPKFFVNNFATPATNVFGTQPQVLTPVDPQKKVTTSFTYTASDGPLTSAPGTVTIEILPPNRPPVFVSTPPTRYVAPAYSTFTYTAQAVDPDPGDTVTYSLKLYQGNGGGCSIDPASGVLSCTVLSSGDQSFVIVATDSFGAAAYQNILLRESAGPATVPNVVGQLQAAAGTTLAAAGFTTGNITQIDNPAPAGQVIQQNPGGGTVALLGSNVDLVVSKGPAPPPPPPGPPPGLGNIKRIVVTPASTVHVVGENVPYKATSINNDGTGDDITAFVVWSSSATAVATVNAGGVAHAAGAGTTTLTATAGGLSGQATLSVAARANSDFTPPTAIITQPAGGGTVTGLTQILGTATDAHFLRYELALEASGDTTFTQFGQGTTQVTNGVLGTLDPTLLLNGAYTLRLTVFDANGNTATADVPIVADGFQKVGNFTLAYTDLTVPLAGIPIQITRLYDSRDKSTGDFGVGWRLGIKALRLSTSGVLGASWQVIQQGTSFALVPGSDHFVSVALPNGKIETFDLQVSPTSSFLVPFTSLFATFVPRPGTLGTLQSLENVNLLIIDPQPGPVTLVDDSLLTTFHPDRFLYTQIDGTQFVVTRTHGVESVTDTNSNQITISAAGISHSSGAAVTFVRDGSGRITSITDPKGQTQTYVYTAAGDLASHADATAATTSYFYNAQHGLVRVVDPLGNAAARTDYDDQGRLLSMTDAAGNTVKYTPDLPGRQEQMEDALGRVTVASYDDRGNVLSVTDALGNTTTSTFDDLDNETSRVDPDGIHTSMIYSGVLPTSVIVDPGGLALTTTNVFNAVNDPTSVTDPAGRVFSFNYDGGRNITQLSTPLAGAVTAANNTQGLPSTVTDSLGTQTVSTWDASGNLAREDVLDSSSALLRRTEFTYDANGNTLSATLYRTIGGVLTPLTASYTYDAAGRNTSLTDPAGGVTHFEYDALGHKTAVIDPVGRRTTYTYDEVGRSILTTYPDGTSEALGYDAVGNTVSRTDRAGRTTTFQYDAANRRIKTVFADGTSTRTLYSAGGRVAASVDAKGSQMDYAYDSAGRLIGTTLPPVLNGVGGPLVRPQTSKVLNPLGLPISAIDANGRQTSFQYDAAGHLIQSTFADGSAAAQTFDALGRRISLTNEEGQTTHFVYDALGRLTAVSGLAGDETYGYDEAGDLLIQTDALGRATQLRYDVLGRLIARTYPTGDIEHFSYDASGSPIATADANGKTTTVTFDNMGRPTRKDFSDSSSVSYTYAADGQRASVTDSRGLTLYGYDAVGRVASVVNPTGETVHYTRDANGNLLSLASPAATVTYTYDALNRLVQANGPDGLAQSFYDLAGNRVRLVAANGTMTDSVYDLRNRPTLLTHRNAGSTLLASFTNVFSPAGRRTQVTELDGSQVQYTYDAKGRLASETRAGVTPLVITHTYDAVGNRTQTVRNGVTTNFTYDVDDRLLGDGTSTYAWDANGNLTSKTTGAFSTLYAWDPQNRLASITDISGVTQYAYDADGNRIQTTTPAGTTRFLVDAANNTGLSQVLEEKDGSGALQARYSYGNELLSMGRSGLASYFHFDAQGSTRTLTNLAGTPTDSYTFDAFGRTVNSTGTTANAYLYGGQRFDAASGFYQLRARYYAPDLGRFVSRDPLGGHLDVPSSLHRYAYAAADPINNSDPTGQETLVELLVAQFNAAVIDIANFISKAQVVCKATTTLGMVAAAVTGTKIAATLLATAAETNATSAEFAAEFKLTSSATLKLAYSLSNGVHSYSVGLSGDLGSKFGGTAESDTNSLAANSGPTLQFSTPPPTVSGAFSVTFEYTIIDFKACGIKPSLGKISLAAKGNAKEAINLDLSADGVGRPVGTAGIGFSLELRFKLFRNLFRFTLPLFAIDPDFVSGKGSITWFGRSKSYP